MKQRWPKHKLSEVADLCLGKMLDKNKNKGELHPYLGNIHVRWGNFDLDDLPQMRFEDHEHDRYGLQRGDLVVCEGGEPGRCALWNDQVPNMKIQKALHRVRPHACLESRYLLYWFLEAGQRKVFDQFCTGSTIKHLPGEKLAIIEVDVPPLPVQQRIADILSAYDELIENSQRRIKILEQMARNLYREWFVHFRFPNHAKTPMVDSPLGKIPKGWEPIPFEQILASMTGGDWGSEQAEDGDTAEVCIVRGTDFDEVAYGGQLRAPVRYIKPSSLKTRELRAGDVLIENSINAKSRCIGTTLLIDNNVLNRLGRSSVAASFCKVFRLHDPRLAPIVHLHVRHLREDARMEYYQNVAANGIGNFQAQKFAKEEHLILPMDDGLRIKLIEEISASFECVGILASQLSNLRKTRDLLLPRLLSGQINVS